MRLRYSSPPDTGRRTATHPRRRRQAGGVLMMFTFMLPFLLVPVVGLGIDATMLYSVKLKMQAAVDGAALASAQSLNAGLTISAQASAAALAADQFIRANIVTGATAGSGGYWGAYGFNDSSCTTDSNGDLVPTGTGTAISYTNSGNCITVTQDNTNKLRTVAVVAAVKVPLLFMRILGFANGTVASRGTASRRDVVMVIVIDRSGSMGTELPAVQAGAEYFVNQFSAGRDKLGLVLMAGSSIVAYPPADWGKYPPTGAVGPDVNFKGSTETPNMVTSLQNMVSSGGNTGMAEAMMMAYYELQAADEPGALNIIVLWTDGEPNGITADFNNNSGSGSAVISTSSGCTYGNGSGGTGVYPNVGANSILGWMAQWGGYSATSNAVLGPFVRAMTTNGPTTSALSNAFVNQTSVAGYVASTLINNDNNNGSNSNESIINNQAGAAIHCGYTVQGSATVGSKVPQPNGWGSTVITGIPKVDYYGDATQGQSLVIPGTGAGAYSQSDFTQAQIWATAGECGYSSGAWGSGGTGPAAGPLQITGTLHGNSSSSNTPQTNTCQFGLASWNAADMAGYKIHQDTTLTPIIYTMGYAPAGGLDATLLQRLANCVPNQPCGPGGSNSSNTVYNPNIPSGMYLQINSVDDVTPAFEILLSQILRLSL